MRNQRMKAFTLIEMMAVVVIIAILAAVIAPKFFGQVGKAQVTTAQKEIEMIKQGITLYRFDTNRFPEELRDLVKEPDDVKGWNGPYFERASLKTPGITITKFAFPVKMIVIWTSGPTVRTVKKVVKAWIKTSPVGTKTTSKYRPVGNHFLMERLTW